MKSFLKGMVQKKEGGLVGRTLRVGSYTVKVEAHLADGGFAAIYKVRDQTTPTAFALKHMRIAGDPEARADCTTEIDVMKRLRGHPNVLTLRAVEVVGTRDAEEALLLLDLCQDSLVDHMRAAAWKLPMGEVVTIFHSVAKAVALMHHQAPPISHRDLKAENVLLHTSGVWVLCDFGSATQRSGAYLSGDAIMVAEDQIRKHTTPAYRAPEMYDLYSREPVGIAADCWALGVLLYFLCTGKLPFQGDCKLQVLNGAYAPMPVTVMPSLKRLVQDLLVVKPANRLTIDEVLRRMEEMTSLVEVPSGVSGPLGGVPFTDSPGGSPSFRADFPEPDPPAFSAAFLPPSDSRLRGAKASLTDSRSSGGGSFRSEGSAPGQDPPGAEAEGGWAGGWAASNWETKPSAAAAAAAGSGGTTSILANSAGGGRGAEGVLDQQGGQQNPPRGAGRGARRASVTGVPSTSQKNLLAGLQTRRVAAPPPPPPQLRTSAAVESPRGLEVPRGDSGHKEKEKLQHVHSHAAEFLQHTAGMQGGGVSGVQQTLGAQLNTPDLGDITPQRSAASSSSVSLTPIPPLAPPPPVAAPPPPPRSSGDSIPPLLPPLLSAPLEERTDSGRLGGRREGGAPGGWATLPAETTTLPGGGDSPSAELAALRRQLGDALAENAQLKGSVRSQGATILQLQAENESLRLSAADRSSKPLDEAPSQDSWAAFPHAHPTSHKPQKPPTSPTRGGSGIPIGSLRRRADFQPLVELEPSPATTIPPPRGGIDPFGGQEDRFPSGTPPGGSDTFSLLSEPSSEQRSSKLTLEKVVGGKHRRTTSEPPPLESWALRNEWP